MVESGPNDRIGGLTRGRREKPGRVKADKSPVVDFTRTMLDESKSGTVKTTSFGTGTGVYRQSHLRFRNRTEWFRVDESVNKGEL